MCLISLRLLLEDKSGDKNVHLCSRDTVDFPAICCVSVPTDTAPRHRKVIPFADAAEIEGPLLQVQAPLHFLRLCDLSSAICALYLFGCGPLRLHS